MKSTRIFWASIFLAIGFAWMTCGTVFAGSGPVPPQPGATITGPELWGVVVINCASASGTLRVKRVVDCNTESEALAGAWTGCPDKLADVENYSLPLNTTFFGLPGTAFINKAKNFQKVGDIVSFDAQFKFWKMGP